MVHGVDVDGDGEPDALAAVAGDNKVVVYTERLDLIRGRNPRLHADAFLSDSNVREPWSVFPADVDGDSDVDILVAASDAGGRVALYDNDGATPPTFTQHLVAPPDDDGGLSLTDPRYVTAVDLLGDGGAPLRLDLLVASNNDGYIGWYQNTGAGQAKRCPPTAEAARCSSRVPRAIQTTTTRRAPPRSRPPTSTATAAWTSSSPARTWVPPAGLRRSSGC